MIILNASRYIQQHPIVPRKNRIGANPIAETWGESKRDRALQQGAEKSQKVIEHQCSFINTSRDSLTEDQKKAIQVVIQLFSNRKIVLKYCLINLSRSLSSSNLNKKHSIEKSKS